MTPAEKFLSHHPNGRQQSLDRPTMPAEAILKAQRKRPEEMETPPNPVPSVSSTSSSSIPMRVLAVIVLLGFIFAGTYFARVSRHPSAFIGFTLGFMGLGLSKMLWSASSHGGSREQSARG